MLYSKQNSLPTNLLVSAIHIQQQTEHRNCFESYVKNKIG